MVPNFVVDIVTAVYSNTEPTHPCPTDMHYSSISGKCYKYFEEKKTWAEAKDNCISISGMSLAKVETKDDLDALFTVLGGQANFEDQWIGGVKQQGKLKVKIIFIN